MGSVGGCHSKVTEEAVTFTKVTFCGGSNGSGYTHKYSVSDKIFTQINGKEIFVDDKVICYKNS